MKSYEIERVCDYYNSKDAQHFYDIIAGGDDIHVGIYLDELDEDIITAGERMVIYMCEKLEQFKVVNERTRLLDLGSGFGGPCRKIAKRYNCEVTGVDISEEQNRKARMLNEIRGIKKITHLDMNFEDLSFENDIFDVILSQDTFLYCPDLKDVFIEAHRVLKKKGIFIFTDLMQAENAEPEDIKPIAERLYLDRLKYVQEHQKSATDIGFELVDYESMTRHMKYHYKIVLKRLLKKEQELKKHVSEEFLQKQKAGLQLWNEGLSKSILEFGVFLFKK